MHALLREQVIRWNEGRSLKCEFLLKTKAKPTTSYLTSLAWVCRGTIVSVIYKTITFLPEITFNYVPSLFNSSFWQPNQGTESLNLRRAEKGARGAGEMCLKGVEATLPWDWCQTEGYDISKMPWDAEEGWTGQWSGCDLTQVLLEQGTQVPEANEESIVDQLTHFEY